MLSRIRLRHYRNYESLELAFRKGVTAVTGANGQGKTNLLEAVYYLSLLRSFRTKEVRSLCRHGTGHFFLGGEVKGETALATDQLAVSYGDRRLLRINGGKIANASDFINTFICLAFVPEDIGIIKGSAGLRRRLADIALSQLHHLYLRKLQNYTNALRQRNCILKDLNRFGVKMLKAYEPALITDGAEIILFRHHWAQEINRLLRDPLFYTEISSHEIYGLDYIPGLNLEQPDLPSIQNRLQRKLAESQEKDIRYGYSHTGPHRDEFNMLCNGVLLSKFGSEGQCRMMAVLIKLAVLKMLRNETAGNGKSLVILVDDIVGELDEKHRQVLYDNVKHADQVFFSCTALPPRLADIADNVLSVSAGQVLGSDMN